MKFCSECKHYHESYDFSETTKFKDTCTHDLNWTSTYHSLKDHTILHPSEINKHNDCEGFERIPPKPRMIDLIKTRFKGIFI